jgi:DNA-binding LacI/PurR family transcriptional regulator
MKQVKKTVHTIADIARLAGVSKSTVSRALNHSPLISAQTRDKIQTIARDHNFQIHRGAQNLSLKRSHTIGFVFPLDLDTGYFVTDPFHLEIIGAIAGALGAYNYDLLLAQVDVDDPTWPHRYLDSGRVDGLVLVTCSSHVHQIESLLALQAPFIVWGIRQPQYSYCSVHGDDVTGGRLAVEHLLQTGRRRIAFLGGPIGLPEVDLRFKGYELALQAAGYAVTPALISYGNYTSRSGAEAMQRLLAQSPRLDAVFVNSDLMAIAAIGMLRERGYKVPDDVAVVGYDDISLAAHCHPSLTTIRQNIMQAGKVLVHNLMQHLDTGIITNVTMPVELVVRKSTAVTP